MTEMRLYDLRVTVERIEGRSVCGLQVGDERIGERTLHTEELT